MDLIWLLVTVVQVVFLYAVLVICSPAIDFVRERMKRIKRNRRRREDRYGWTLLLVVILCFMWKC